MPAPAQTSSASADRIRSAARSSRSCSGRCLDATDRCTTSNSSSDDPDATGRARSPECAVIAGPFSQAWNDSSLSQCVTTK